MKSIEVQRGRSRPRKSMDFADGEAAQAYESAI